MAYTPDPAASSEAQTESAAVVAPSARPKLRDQIAENPLLSLYCGLLLLIVTLFGTAVAVVLLVFLLTST